MKIIDLLNKIANGEEVPEKIKYNTRTWYYKEGIMEYISENDCFSLSNFEFNQLNDEVEIIEEDKKIEKLKQRTDTGLFGSMINDEIRVAEAINKQANYLSDIVSTINEIIDYLEEK